MTIEILTMISLFALRMIIPVGVLLALGMALSHWDDRRAGI
jgi:hypothetical protein